MFATSVFLRVDAHDHPAKLQPDYSGMLLTMIRFRAVMHRFSIGPATQATSIRNSDARHDTHEGDVGCRTYGAIKADGAERP